MIKVVLLGAGNLAYHLFRVFKASKDVEIIQIFNHRKEKLAGFNNEVATTTLLSEIKEADFYLISVKDDAIIEVSSQLQAKNSIVLHTSGAVSMDILARHSNIGVFYPLQSFSKEKEVGFEQIPICIEANSEENLKNQIAKLNNNLSSKQSIIDEKNISIGNLQKELNPFKDKINELEKRIDNIEKDK